MAGNSISPETLKFIGLCIESVEQLEILCLLVENSSRDWSVKEIFRVIQSTETSITMGLEKFVKADLAIQNAEFRHRFSAEGKASDAARALVKIYRERPVSVIEAIYSRPTDAVQSFADAFRFRKEK
ncbi:MAG TPA: hypothetical protein VGO67_02410 [Verrucomicrobiae bacterium]|jgi:hypothetical protein